MAGKAKKGRVIKLTVKETGQQIEVGLDGLVITTLVELKTGQLLSWEFDPKFTATTFQVTRLARKRRIKSGTKYVYELCFKPGF